MRVEAAYFRRKIFAMLSDMSVFSTGEPLCWQSFPAISFAGKILAIV